MTKAGVAKNRKFKALKVVSGGKKSSKQRASGASDISYVFTNAAILAKQLDDMHGPGQSLNIFP
jgi:hypothetical protein